MVCPYRHIADYTETTAEEAEEISVLTKEAMHTLRGVSGVQGFNIGMNQGAVAGAGIAAPLHQHVVPRWLGDQNFMPVIGQTKTLPESCRALTACSWRRGTPPRQPAQDPIRSLRKPSGREQRWRPTGGATRGAAPSRRRAHVRTFDLQVPGDPGAMDQGITCVRDEVMPGCHRHEQLHRPLDPGRPRVRRVHRDELLEVRGGDDGQRPAPGPARAGVAGRSWAAPRRWRSGR